MKELTTKEWVRVIDKMIETLNKDYLKLAMGSVESKMISRNAQQGAILSMWGVSETLEQLELLRSCVDEMQEKGVTLDEHLAASFNAFKDLTKSIALESISFADTMAKTGLQNALYLLSRHTNSYSTPDWWGQHNYLKHVK